MKATLAMVVAGLTFGLFADNWNGTNGMANDDSLEFAELNIGNRGEGSAILKDRARLLVGNLTVGRNDGGDGSLLLQDSSTVTVTNGMNVGRTSLTKGFVAIRHEAGLVVKKSGVFLSGGGTSSAREARFVQEGGTVEGAGMPLGLNGTNSVVELKGGISVFEQWRINGQSADGSPFLFSTNRLVVSGGEHTVNSTIELNVANAVGMLSIEGGRVNANFVKLGSGAASDGGVHLIRLLGGEFFLKNGFAEAKENGRFLADGGTIVGSSLDDDIPHFILGGKGLVYQADRAGLKLNQAFEDADGADGRFVKTGAASVGVERASSHAVTEVNEGELLVNAGAFGRKIVVQNKGVLSVGSGTAVAVDEFVWGGADGSAGVLKPGAAGTSLTVGSLAVHCGVVDVTNIPGGGTVLTSTAVIDAGVPAKLTVLEREAGKDYVFSLSDDRKSVLFASADLDENAKTSIKESVTVSEAQTLKGEVSVSGGDSTFSGAVDMKGVLTFDIASGSSLTLGRGDVNALADVVKTGEGRLILEGNIANASGDWGLSRGVISVRNGNGFGQTLPPSSSVTLSSGTLHFAEGDATTVGHAVKIAAPTGNDRVIVSTDRAVTFGNGIDSAAGTFIKTGKETMTVEFGNATYKLGTKSENDSASATTALPDDGASPAAPEKTAPLEVLDGALVLRGAGADVSKIEQTQPLFIGTPWAGAVAQAGMVLDGVGYTQGGASRPLVIGNGVKEGAPNAPCLKVLNSVLDSNTITLGGGSNAVYPLLAVTNSAVNLIYALNVGGSDRNASLPSAVHPSVELGAGAQVRVHRASGSSEGISLYRDVNVLVSDGACLEAKNNGNAGWKGVYLRKNASGIVKVRRGGVLRPSRFTEEANPVDGGFVGFEFDGGVLNMVETGETRFALRPQQGFTSVGAGMEVKIDEGVTHTFACPFGGDGAIVKTGAGTLAFAADGDAASVTSAGGIVVKEGVARISGRVLGEGVEVDVKAGAVLDLGGAGGTETRVAGVFGAGTVRNGLLAGAVKADVDNASPDGLITLGEDVTVQNADFRVKFAWADPDSVKGRKVPVCRLADGVAADCSRWRASGLPQGNSIYFF